MDLDNVLGLFGFFITENRFIKKDLENNVVRNKMKKYSRNFTVKNV